MEKLRNSKETRRHFIQDKLWKGLLVSLVSPFSSMANVSSYQDESVPELYNKDGEVNWDKVKGQFTLFPKRGHFNTASVGPSPLVVQEKTIEAIRYIEARGVELHKKLGPVREKLASLLNTNSDQLAIIRNTTEGMNIVARSLRLRKGDEVILTSEEHVGGSAPWLALQNEIGIQVIVIDISGRESDAYDLIKCKISKKTKVVSISHITCTVGAVLPVKKIIDLCREHNIQSCIDGAQAVGQIKVDINHLNPDFYVSSGHKWLFGPKGTGILYLNKQFLENTPPHYTGAYTDSKFDLKLGVLEYVKTASRYEYGTINSPIVVGFGAAIDFISNIGLDKISSRGKALAAQFRAGISVSDNITILTPEDSSISASILTFKIKDKQSADVCRNLRKGGATVIRSVTENNMNAIRVSFAVFTSHSDVKALINRILDEVHN
jgi:selenocysteine lyase/cysteine desulfurase